MRSRRRPQPATARSTPRARSPGCAGSIDASTPRRSARPRRSTARAGPAIAYLARVDSTDAAEVRLARFRRRPVADRDARAHDLPRGRRARPTPRASGSRSTATSRSRSPTSTPARHSVRLVGEDARPQRFGTVPVSAARATLSFGANGEVGVVCAGLAGEDSRLWVATGRLGGATHTFAPMGQSVSSAAITGFTHGAPIVAFRDRRGALVAVPGRSLPQLAGRTRVALQREQPVQRRLRAARPEPTESASRWSATARCSCSPRTAF